MVQGFSSKESLGNTTVESVKSDFNIVVSMYSGTIMIYRYFKACLE
jgi:hypothetical protein